jgi:hypothetical protein
MNNNDHTISVDQAVELQLGRKHAQTEREMDRLLIDLNRALSTPPGQKLEEPHIGKNTHKSEYGD